MNKAASPYKGGHIALYTTPPPYWGSRTRARYEMSVVSLVCPVRASLDVIHSGFTVLSSGPCRLSVKNVKGAVNGHLRYDMVPTSLDYAFRF